MHVGRRLGNPIGGFLPESLPGIPPDTPFLDMRLTDKVSTSITIWVDVPRFEHLVHLYKNGQYRQTRRVLYTPIDVFIVFEVEDTGPAVLTASVFRRDNPEAIDCFTELTLSGIGIIETDQLNTSQTITSLGGGWFSVLMRLSVSLSDQHKLNFSIVGGNTRIGSLEISGIENGNARFKLDPDLTQWNAPLTPNGLTGSGDTAYDLLNSIPSFHDILKFIISFEEQILGIDRSRFSAIISGPRLSFEGREIEARGIMEYCPTSRIHLEWLQFSNQGELSRILIETSKDGLPYVQIDSVTPGTITYTTQQLQQGSYRFRLRAQDLAGNISNPISFADFAPDVWIDTIDPSVVFTDLAGTIFIENDQDIVARIDNKGSFVLAIQQTVLANRPIFVYEGINHGAGLDLQNTSSHLDGGPAASWLGPGQTFDLYMSVLLRNAPLTNPINSQLTTDFNTIFAFNGFFEIIAAKFTNQFFESLQDDFNTGYAVIIRIYTGAGTLAFSFPIILETLIIIKASFDGAIARIFVNEQGIAIPVTGPIAPTNVLIWGAPAAGKGIDGYVGPVIAFIAPQPTAISNQILSLLSTESSNPYAFIVPEEIVAPANILIIFSGMNGTVSSSSSTTPSVTGYNLYHNSGINEFPDFSAPAMSALIPSFIVPMIPGLWRIVIRATDGTIEDGNFENRLDILVIEDSPGVLKLAGPEPNPVHQFEVVLKPNGFVEFFAIYRSIGEAAIGNSVQIWIFEEYVPPDFTAPPQVTMFIPFHPRGVDNTFLMTSTTIGPLSELNYYAIARVMSDNGDFETQNLIRVKFSPDATNPSAPTGLRGNPC